MTAPLKVALEAEGRLLSLALNRPKANLIDAAIKEERAERESTREDKMLASQVARNHPAFPVDIGRLAAVHSSHPPAKTRTFSKPNVMNAPATIRLS